MKSNYLNDLEREFYFVSDEEREQIIGEYSVHFEERIKEGATEEEIIINMGTPKNVAIEYATELGIKYSSFDKYVTNTKRDSNIYYKGLKKKFEDLKHEEALKRKNKKQYVTSENQQCINDKSSKEQTNIIVRTFNLTASLLLKFLYALKVFVSMCIKTSIKFSLFICGILFSLAILPIIAIMILTPVFVTFINYKASLWTLFYIASIFAIIFLATCAYTCYKLFERR